MGVRGRGRELIRGFGKLPDVEDYAGRKGLSIEETEYWLRPNLGYEPERAAVATS